MRETKCDVVRQEEKESGKHLACRRGFCFYWILHGREGREEQFTQEDKEVTELYLDMKEERQRSLKHRQYLNKKIWFWITKENVGGLFFFCSKVSETVFFFVLSYSKWRGLSLKFESDIFITFQPWKEAFHTKWKNML